MEQNQQYNQEIIEIIKKSRCAYSTILKYKKSCKHLLDYIFGWCRDANAPTNLPFPTMVFWTLNGLTEQPKCSNVECSNSLPIYARCHPLEGFGYRCCSNSCAQRDPHHQEDQQKKSLAKYGTKYPSQSKQARSHMKATLASKPKEHWVNANARRVATLQRNYGAGITNVSQLESHKKSVSEAWDEKSVEEIADITRRRKKRKLELYGDENYANAEKISETKQAFSEEKKTEIAKKRKATNLKNLGVEYVWHQENVKQKARLERCKRRYDNAILTNDDAFPLFSFEEYLAKPRSKDFKWKCKKCGLEFRCGVGQHYPYIARCLKCHPLASFKSPCESELSEMTYFIPDAGMTLLAA